MREDEHLRRLLEAQARRKSLMNLKQYNEGKAELPKSEVETEVANLPPLQQGEKNARAEGKAELPKSETETELFDRTTRLQGDTREIIASHLSVPSGTLAKMRTIWQAAQSGDAAAR